MPSKYTLTQQEIELLAENERLAKSWDKKHRQLLEAREEELHWFTTAMTLREELAAARATIHRLFTGLDEHWVALPGNRDVIDSLHGKDSLVKLLDEERARCVAALNSVVVPLPSKGAGELQGFREGIEAAKTEIERLETCLFSQDTVKGE